VNLIIKGGENEVDRTILEQVKAPLVHLLRNAVDHGLESPEKREAAGKPRQGRLELTAAQRGANLQVEVSEDGGGIDVNKVRDSAVRKGLLSQEAAAAMPDQEAMWLIFRPGFSTKSEVTDLSGRGVGLDVVRENVEGLGGMIDVKSELGVGTTFTLTLPMSVATTLVMIVECGSRRFALPVTNILRIMKIKPSEIGQLRGRAAIDFEGRPIALTQLSSALGMNDASADLIEGKAVQALIVGSADKRYAFLVDGILGAQEVVVKSLLPPLDRVRRVAGATILGTGEVVMVVNVADLIRSSSVHNLAFSMGKGGTTPSSSEIVRKSAKVAEPPLVLCVDDSFTTRTLVKSIVEAAGYRTKQAADGLEAWNILQNEPIQLVVTDVNMPRMDGFELTRTIRKNLQTKDLPVILVTSLDSPEERAEGVDAGADAHIVKGALRQEDLLETIKRLL
jgi:two-component system chemotaxis sensor kinase CheA